MTGAVTRIEGAKQQHAQLRDAFRAWVDNRGIELVTDVDNEYARIRWLAHYRAEPETSLALVACEIVNNLRSAIDFVAFEIFLAAGGDATSRQAKAVAFPI